MNTRWFSPFSQLPNINEGQKQIRRISELRSSEKAQKMTYYGSVAKAFDTADGLILFKFSVSMLGTRMHASLGSVV